MSVSPMAGRFSSFLRISRCPAYATGSCLNRIKILQRKIEFHTRPSLLQNTPAAFETITPSKGDAKDFQISSSPIFPPTLVNPELPVSLTNKYYLNAFCSPNNTHLTFSNYKRDVLISLSAGQVGFKKAKRGSYEAGYEVCTEMCKRIRTKVNGEQNKRGKSVAVPPLNINSILLTFRGFGLGREAVQKCILSVEGAIIRDKIRYVADATRLKFGGTRSPAKRRI